MSSQDESRDKSGEQVVEIDAEESPPKNQGGGSPGTSRGSQSAQRSRAGDQAAPEGSSEGTQAVRTAGEANTAPETEVRPSAAAAGADTSAARRPAGAGHDQPPDVRPIGPRPAQFMLAPRQASGLQPLSADVVAQSLKDAPGIEIVKTIDPPRVLRLQESDATALGSLVVARMSYDKARLLQGQAGGRLAIEHDAPITYGLDPGPAEFALPNPGVIVPLADGFETIIEVRGPDGPLEDAEVYVFGTMLPAQAVTDAAGRATITFGGESPDTIRALYVKPKADYWDLWLPRPLLNPGIVNTVVAKPLSALLKDFPDRQLLGWGQRAMGLDRIPPSFDGAGVKIAIIDSGAAQPTHRNLHRLGPGISVVGNDRTAWTTDIVGHGSHCAGVIGGGPIGTAAGVRGFAPGAEIHVCRIFPGARFSDLVAALDYCMENGIDVANMSLGGGEPSQIVEQRIIKAKEMGVACIIAAGNSAGPVQFPASTRHALAVAAIGKWGEFPDDSFHSTQVLQGFEAREGYFPAKFSCFGPEVDVCAPGVAIVSSLPPDDFAAWDGTSMAAPHITGLAALVLAHHPDFKGPFQARDARRVERLFQIIKESALPLPVADSSRIGAGLPDAPRALGLEAAAGAQPSARSSSASEASVEALKRLLALVAGSNGSLPAAVIAGQPRSAAAEPFRNAEVDRGPAQTGRSPHGLAPASAGFGPPVSAQGSGGHSLGEFAAALKRAGLL